jgi:hypothetical protein
MALLGQGLVRKMVLLKDHLEAVTGMLDLARDEHREVPEPVLHNLRSMIGTLQEIPAEFEADFARQLVCATEPRSDGKQLSKREVGRSGAEVCDSKGNVLPA